MKKKKSKKATTDFAAELDEMDAENDEAAALNGDDGNLGDDVFDKPNGEAESGKEAWVMEGRDPTYPEVSRGHPIHVMCHVWRPATKLLSRCATPSARADVSRLSFYPASSPSSTLTTPNSPARNGNTPWYHPKSLEKEPKRPSLPTSPTSVAECIDNQSTSFSSCTLNWERRDQSTVCRDWS